MRAARHKQTQMAIEIVVRKKGTNKKNCRCSIDIENVSSIKNLKIINVNLCARTPTVIFFFFLFGIRCRRILWTK